jgi:hypothetical protein
MAAALPRQGELLHLLDTSFVYQRNQVRPASLKAPSGPRAQTLCPGNRSEAHKERDQPKCLQDSEGLLHVALALQMVRLRLQDQ